MSRALLKARGYAVHVLTASGIVFMFLAAAEMMRESPRVWLVFIWFIAATLVDAIDGPLARIWKVKTYADSIDGRTIDDIVDYLGFTFLPLLLIWRMDWLPAGVGELAVMLAMIASLLGFAHRQAKDEEHGFFRGFPSYWNIVAFYAGLSAALLPTAGPWINAGVLLALAAMTVSPVWLIYPNLAPRQWKVPVLWGSYIWALALAAMLPWYPSRVPAWAVLASLIYPAFYLWVSIHLRASWPTRPSREDEERVQTG